MRRVAGAQVVVSRGGLKGVSTAVGRGLGVSVRQEFSFMTVCLFFKVLPRTARAAFERFCACAVSLDGIFE